MINSGRVNSMPINAAYLTDSYRHVEGALGERLIGWLRLGADKHITARTLETLGGAIVLTSGRRSAALTAESLTGHVSGLSALFRVHKHQESLGGALVLGATIHRFDRRNAEGLAGSMRLGADVYPRQGNAEALVGDIVLGADVHLERQAYESLNGFASLRDLVESTLHYNGSIPPGGRVVIDSDSFTVMLNNQNAIKHHRGDWIWVGPESIVIELQSIGSEDYTMEVYYNAQYL